MRMPELRAGERTRVLQRAFGGYDRRLPTPEGAFPDMKNLTAERWPLLCTRRRLTHRMDPAGLPLEGVLAAAGAYPVLLRADGSLTAGERVLEHLITFDRWDVRYPRQMVLMGAWAVIFPDGVYANTQRLRQGAELIRGEDYGSIRADFTFRRGAAVFTPCTFDGTEIQITKGNTAPADGYWIDTSEPNWILRSYSQSQGQWLAATAYVKFAAAGIARELRAWDGVEIVSRLEELGALEGLDELEALLTGSRLLVGARRDELGDGAGDYLILEGLLSARVELELTGLGNAFVTLTRPLPELDYVVSCQNRLWGCHWGGGKNEILASKLGDFRNWAVFQGLSTDSYAAVRGSQGPFTGAAVLGNNPLFFKEKCLEKVFPDENGAHRILTQDLDGVEEGSWRSLCVFRDRLYYKSPGGICAYNGTLPRLISQPLGPERYHGAVAAAGGGKYWVGMKTETGEPRWFVLSLDTGLWHRLEDRPIHFAWCEGDCFCFTQDPTGPVRCLGAAADSRDVDWYAETGDLGPDQTGQRTFTGLKLRLRLDPGAMARVYASYDRGPWIRKDVLLSDRKYIRVLHLRARTCSSFRLRLEGRGGCVLEELSWLVK